MAPGSHGTHVASIAAGNRGVCRQARIAGVLDLAPGDGRRSGGSRSTTRAGSPHAVDYLLRLGRELGLPVSINISLGTNGALRTTAARAVTRWIDAALTRAGPQRPRRGRQRRPGARRESRTTSAGSWAAIHAERRSSRPRARDDLEWVVVGNGIMDISENELEIWYGAQDRFAVSVKPPGHATGSVRSSRASSSRTAMLRRRQLC